MTIEFDGQNNKLGINTASPTAKLQITAESATSGEDLIKLANGADASELVIDTSANAVNFNLGTNDVLKVIGGGGSSGATIPTGTNVFIENNGDAKLSIASPDANEAMIILGSATDQSGSIFQYDHTDLSTTIGSQTINGIVKILSGNGNERVRIDNSGHVIIPNGVTLGTAVGTYNAANTIDDYEEGTWTPVVSDASSGGNNPPNITASGAYTKIGRMVRVSFQLANIDTTGMTSGNSLYVQGLPFTTGSSTPLQLSDNAVKCDRINFTNYVIASSSTNNSYFEFRDIRDNATDTALLVSAVTSTGSDISGSITYFT